MACVTTTTTSGPCVSCIHPFDYLFELAYQTSKNVNSRIAFDEALDRILDKGIINTNCNLCCPDCQGVYSLSSVQTFLIFAESIGMTDGIPGIAFGNGEPCCSNVYSAVETWLTYYEALILSGSGPVASKLKAIQKAVNTNVPYSDDVVTCCNGFTECIDDLVCWLTEGSALASDILDRLKDKGVVEYGGIYNNCTKSSTSSICHIIELLTEKYPDVSFSGTKGEFIDRIFDRGIVISCSSNGEIIMGSTESWLKYADAVGLTASAVPALSETTTTTTIAA